MNLLQAEHISFSYDDQCAIDRVSLSLRAGEVVALIGPNGSGKSTLIKLLMGLLPAEGTILWDDRPLSQWPLRDRARYIAYLPQAPMADEDKTVGDILRLGRTPYLQSFGLESAADIDIVHQVSALLGLDPFLNRRNDELSGGQRQRVFIGRCLAQQPRALILDEPHTYLDLRYQTELSKLLRKLAREQNLGILLSSHDLNLAASLSDRLVLLHEGRMAASGPPTEVFDPAILSKVYGVSLELLRREGKTPLIFPVMNEE